LQDGEVKSLQIPFWIWVCVAAMIVVFVGIFAIIYVALVRQKKAEPGLSAATRTFGGNIYIRPNSRYS
jgi:hypothetical protein